MLATKVMAAALIDRPLPHCHMVNVSGNGYRMREHQDLLRSGSEEVSKGAQHRAPARSSRSGGTAGPSQPETQRNPPLPPHQSGWNDMSPASLQAAIWMPLPSSRIVLLGSMVRTSV